MTVIESLEIKNFQRVSAVKIEPSNNVIMLFGKNAQGKSSILKAIQTALEGYNSRTTKRPVHGDALGADIKISFTDGTKVHRKFRPSGPSLVAADGDGAKWGQKELNSAISALGTDARAFVNKGAKEQLDLLLSVVKLDINPVALDAEYKRVEADRTLIGRQGAAIGDVVVDPDLPAEETNATDLISQIQIAEESNRARADHEANIALYEKSVADTKAEIALLAASLKVSEDQLTALHNTPVDPVTDTAPLKAQLATVSESNTQIRANNAAREQAQAKAGFADQWNAKTARLTAIKDEKAAGLAKAVMPVEGLSFDEEGVLYQGVPLSEASSSEAVIVSFAMIVATNPKIRTAVIRNGNDLDERSLGIIQTIAEANDFQVFIEFVSDSEDHEMRIVDGELVLGDAA